LADAARWRALAAGLAWFAASEIVCAVEEYVLRTPSTVLACAHSLTSGLALGLATLGLFEVLDGSVLHFVDRGGSCVGMRLCRECAQRATGRCRFRGTLQLVAAAVAFMAVPLLFAPVARVVTHTADWTVPVPAWESAFAGLMHRAPGVAPPAIALFYVPAESLWLEFRLLPVVVIALAAFALAALLAGREGAGVRSLALAAGVLFFVASDAAAYALRGDAYLGGLLHECEELVLLILLASFWKQAGGAPERPQRGV
jgi:hypothetical protein